MLVMAPEGRRLRRPREIRNEELYSIEAAAAYKGVSTRAVYQRINAGLLPFMRLVAVNKRGTKLVYKGDLDAWEVARGRQQQRRQREE